MRQLIFTIVFGLLVISAFAGRKKSYYFVGVWDGKEVKINNPNVVNKNKFCIKYIRINGVKIKANYKEGGIIIDPKTYGFSQGKEFLFEIVANEDCEPSFHSEGFKMQR